MTDHRSFISSVARVAKSAAPRGYPLLGVEFYM